MTKSILKYALIAAGVLCLLAGQFVILGGKKIFIGALLSVPLPVILLIYFVDIRKVFAAITAAMKTSAKDVTLVPENNGPNVPRRNFTIPFRKIKYFAIFAAAILAAEAGVRLYKSNMIFTGTVFFLTAFAVLLVLAYMGNRETDSMELFEYKRDKPLVLVVKAAAALILAFLAQYFIYNRYRMLGLFTYIIALFQVMFIFRFLGKVARPVEPVRVPVKSGKSDKIDAVPVKANDMTARLQILISLAAAVILLYFSREWLSKYMVNAASLVFVLAAAALFYISRKTAALQDETPLKVPVIFDYILLAAVVAAGFYFRAVNITSIPPGMSLDEGLGIYQAEMITKGDRIGIFIANVQFQVASLYYYVLAMIGKIWPLSLELSRMVSVVAGSLTIIFMYLLGKELYSRRAGLLAAAIMAVSCVHLTYSRVAWLWIFVPLIAVAAFYFYMLGERKGRTIYFVLSGALLGLGLYYYNAAKMAPVVLAAYWAVLALKKDTRPFVKKNYPALLAVLVMGFVVFLPLLQYILTYSKDYFFRISTESAFRGDLKSCLSPLFMSTIIKHALETLLMFTTKASRYGYFNFPNKPLFDPVSSFLALAGLAVIGAGIKKKNNIFMLLWLAISVSAAMMAYHTEDPNTQRAILTMPALMLVAAVGFDTLLTYFEKAGKKAAVISAPFIMIAAMAFISYDNLYTYFKLYPYNRDVQSSFFIESKLAADEVVQNKEKAEYFSPYFNAMQGFGMIITMAKVNNFNFSDISLLELNKYYNDKKIDVVIGAEGIYKDYINIFKEYFPNTIIKLRWNSFYKGSDLLRHYSFRDREEPALFYVTARIPYSDIKALYTIKALVRKKTGSQEDINLDNAVVQADGNESAVLRSLIDMPFAGDYRFSCDGASASFLIDGRPVSGMVKLYKGLHRFNATISHFNKPEASINWEMAGKIPAGRIPINYFINSGKIYGLLGEYTSGGQAMNKELDPTVCFRNYFFQPRAAFAPGQGLLDMVWTGNLTLPSSGNYTFILKSAYASSVYIDGSQAFKKNDVAEEPEKKLRLSAGRHTVKISYAYRGSSQVFQDNAVFQFEYKKDGDLSFRQVPYWMLSY